MLNRRHFTTLSLGALALPASLITAASAHAAGLHTYPPGALYMVRTPA